MSCFKFLIINSLFSLINGKSFVTKNKRQVIDVGIKIFTIIILAVCQIMVSDNAVKDLFFPLLSLVCYGIYLLINLRMLNQKLLF